MSAGAGGRLDRPVMIPQIACYADDGCFVAEAGSQAAEVLAELPALRKPHDSAGLGVPTAADTTELLTAAGELAFAAGWVQRVDGYWLCPAHAGVYLDAEPRRFTVAECVRRHRLRNAG